MFVLQILVGSKTVYMYQGDHWNQNGPGSVGNAPCIWLSLVPDYTTNTFMVEWHGT